MRALLFSIRTQWPPLVSPEAFWAVYRKLADPKRTTTKTDRPGGRLLSAVARCGACGGKLRAALVVARDVEADVVDVIGAAVLGQRACVVAALVERLEQLDPRVGELAEPDAHLELDRLAVELRRHVRAAVAVEPPRADAVAVGPGPHRPVQVGGDDAEVVDAREGGRDHGATVTANQTELKLVKMQLWSE